MTVVYPGEEVVLDLVVESAVQVAEQGAAHVGGCGNLRGVIILVTLLFLIALFCSIC